MSLISKILILAIILFFASVLIGVPVMMIYRSMIDDGPTYDPVVPIPPESTDAFEDW